MLRNPVHIGTGLWKVLCYEDITSVQRICKSCMQSYVTINSDIPCKMVSNVLYVLKMA